MIRREPLHVLSAGAAKAVVLALEEALRETAIAGTFDAAGAIRARFLAGDACDVLVLPAAMLEALAAKRQVEPASMAALGRVPTGIAVVRGVPAPPIATAAALGESLERASALYCPDTVRATAGIHFVHMLREMEIHARVASRIRAYANGAEAMAALAATRDPAAIGCTQVTEILYTPGVALAGPLPAPFDLSTTYAVAVAAAGADRSAARDFAARLAGEGTRALREASGFAQT